MTSHVHSDEKLESMSSMNGNALSKTVTLDAELFEKLYLSPKNVVAGDLRKTFGNPTPVYESRSRGVALWLMLHSALMGFIVGLTPLSIALMGWRGAAGGGVATGFVPLIIHEAR